MYRHKIHYCKPIGKYYNIDYNNLMLMQGDTPEEVEAKYEGGKGLEIFRNITEMRITMRDRRLTGACILDINKFKG